MKYSMHPEISSRQKGVGLIEVLIAVLVVSIGFLGVAALQVMSLSTNNSAMARSMATVSTYSILDAMRLDKSNALNGAYDGEVAGNDCPAIPSTVTLVGTQLHGWCEQLASNLGAGADTTGTVECDKTSSDHGYCTVTIKFPDNRSNVGGGVDDTGLTTVTTKADL